MSLSFSNAVKLLVRRQPHPSVVQSNFSSQVLAKPSVNVLRAARLLSGKLPPSAVKPISSSSQDLSGPSPRVKSQLRRNSEEPES